MMMPLADNVGDTCPARRRHLHCAQVQVSPNGGRRMCTRWGKRREQELIADESRSRLPLGVKARMRTPKREGGQSTAIHSTGKVAQAAISNQGAFDIKWYTFTPMILVHFWIVDNNPCARNRDRKEPATRCYWLAVQSALTQSA